MKRKQRIRITFREINTRKGWGMKNQSALVGMMVSTRKQEISEVITSKVISSMFMWYSLVEYGAFFKLAVTSFEIYEIIKVSTFFCFGHVTVDCLLWVIIILIFHAMHLYYKWLIYWLVIIYCNYCFYHDLKKYFYYSNI